ncbi:MAG: 2',5' RNA ligase family [candidate division WS6 bacterium OLB20]|uniref:RNA 2',3'-cyclic phosphodiesterase n=1 Tax=candidate division WS6 bacterium OLB20 TaxID=1617426 RepID=A0A136LX50_9BACT|nr:MAG: 2',5' RNA ligase family [candidate division WS6 bacterium OLB20]
MITATTLHRAFIAILPDDKTRAFLRDSIRVFNKEARNFRFVNVDQLHITLEFLGDSVSSESITAITQELSSHKGNFPKPSIGLTELRLGFPGQTMPNVLFWNLSGGQKLKDLTRYIHEEIVDLQLTDVKRHKDHAKLIHHITIGRAKRSISRAHARSVKEIIKGHSFGELPVFTPEVFSIIASELTPKGPVYKTLEEITL